MLPFSHFRRPGRFMFLGWGEFHIAHINLSPSCLEMEHFIALLLCASNCNKQTADPPIFASNLKLFAGIQHDSREDRTSSSSFCGIAFAYPIAAIAAIHVPIGVTSTNGQQKRMGEFV